MMEWLWLELLIAGFIFYESVLISIYRLIAKSNPEQTTWIILGSKVVKILLTVGAILAVRYLTEIPLKRFALSAVAIYFVTILFESVYFLKKKK